MSRGCRISAAAFFEAIFMLLKAGMRAGSELCSIRRFVTARVIWRAVAISEITSNQLKIRKQAIGQQSSKRRFVTARVIWRAAAISEITFVLLLV